MKYLAVPVVLLAILAVAGHADHHLKDEKKPTASREDFQQLGKWMVGDWDVVGPAFMNAPDGSVKIGDEIQVKARMKWVMEKQGLAWEHGPGMFNIWFGYDESAKMIKAFQVSATGRTSHFDSWNSGAYEYSWKLTAGPLKGTGTTVFNKGGSEIVISSDNLVLNGEKLGKLRDVYTKVTK